mmetsp:Transcript_23315/g.32674  ORF Transcript_23315/g.32674 Transcript_23315/m.32674 type:complete len:653 (+) Transcript_23315:143-2101(+)
MTHRNMSRIRLVWHRRDLRLLDNPLYQGLTTASHTSFYNGSSNNKDSSSQPSVLSLYVFDESSLRPRPSTCNPTKWDAVTIGPHTCRLLLEAVHELRSSIRAIGGELIVRVGDPAIIVPQIAHQIHASEVWWSEEPGTYEKSLSQSVRNNIMQLSCTTTSPKHVKNDHHYLYTQETRPPLPKIVQKIGYTLYHPDDLPKDSNEWSQLAHPKQKNNKKKNRQQQKNHAASSLQPPSSSVTTFMYNDQINLEQHDIVDVSSERFNGMSRIMGDFRKAARASTKVRSVLARPCHLQLPPSYILDGVDIGDIPSLEDLVKPLMGKQQQTEAAQTTTHHHRPLLGLDSKLIDRVVLSALSRQLNSDTTGVVDDDIIRGGESHALKRLHEFVNNGHAGTADRSLADVSGNNSSKLAVHLALGTLSPRTIYETVKERGEGCQWLVSHLEMRDFFLFLAFASDSQLYQLKGMPVGKKHVPPPWYNPAAATSGSSNNADDLNKQKQWEQWASGETGLPLVDAAMKELITTGYCSNRVRQNAASLLTKDLNIDWRAGAEWFQFLLEDHCVGANWGNWLYFSGVGPDPKNRHFRTISQALRYDPDGTYVKKWLPLLSGVEEKEAFFRPWDFITDWNDEVVVSPKTQLTWQDLQRFEQTGKLLD